MDIRFKNSKKGGTSGLRRQLVSLIDEKNLRQK